ncbi:MAG TPA: thiamine pyrophosphate-dependent enzyme, partial [Steroidobacteraceae bacterium]|nr:thiamine pyrophosphate-dependent enzyme [Steroidobacteraceae bacterium]
TLFQNPQRCFVSINVCRHDVAKNDAIAVQGDAARSLGELDALLGEPRARADLAKRIRTLRASWSDAVDAATKDVGAALPSDAQVLGAVNRTMGPKGTVVCAAGGLPGELHKLWRAQDANAYHLEYGYSCMGYEIAGGLGVKLALRERDVVVMVGDGSYLMMNSEIATSVAMGLKLTIVLLDNRGFGCINRLQGATGGESFNNLLDDRAPDIDFAAHARALGAHAQKVGNIRELEDALRTSRTIDRTVVLVIDTDPQQSTGAGGAWWDVAVPEVSSRANVTAAYEAYSATLAETKKHL